MTRGRAFKALEFSAQFEKSCKKLGSSPQKQCDEALDQLLEDPVRPGLHLKPILPGTVYWEARISKADRIVLRPSADTSYVVDVVKHDEIAKYSRR